MDIVCLKVSNHDLLHAVVALYAVSLSEMTPDILYASVCDKWARTIILLRDADGMPFNCCLKLNDKL